MAKQVRFDNVRVLIYSHDTFGLGHLRRCRALAHGLVGRYKGLSVLILSGSPVIGGFEFRARVDFVRIPGVIKLKDGRYTSLGLHIELDQTMAIREAIIRQTAAVFAPHLFIVDKEPLGLEGEVKATLKMLRAQGAITVLGERDVIDDSRALRAEWERKAVLPALEELYDEIWVYGLKHFYDPLQGLGLARAIHDKTIFTGYLRRSTVEEPLSVPQKPYILVTPGGGKDGEAVVELVFQCYSQAQHLDTHVVFVLGPFMHRDKREDFKQRSAQSPHFTVLDFHSRIETLIDNAQAMVAMCGYNTFCEILSFNKPAVVIPRFQPRTEQLIRARRAAELGLVSMLEPTQLDVANLLPLLTQLPHARPPQPPADLLAAGLLDGMNTVCARVMQLLTRDDGGERKVVSG